MKHRIKRVLQALLGLDGYLYLFAIFKILTLRWDPYEGAFFHFLRLIPEGRLMLDIGANIGVMTVLMARHVRPGWIYAFEPMPANHRTLQRVVKLFRLKNAVTWQIAVGNMNGSVEMVMPVQDGVRLQGTSRVVQGENVVGDRVTVEMRRLDDFILEISSDSYVGAIKLDVEGYEIDVLQGARDLLARDRPVVYAEMGERRDESLTMFRALDYRITVLDGRQLVDFDPVHHTRHWNFVLIPNPKSTPSS